VLDRRVDDPGAGPRGAAVQAEQATMDRLGARGDERDLVGPHPQDLGGRGPCVVQDQPCGAAGVVQAAGVGVRRLEGGRERLPGCRV
jgi:hypothetical protein